MSELRIFLKEIQYKRSGTGQIKVDNSVIYYKGLEDTHQFGIGFLVHKEFSFCVKEFNPISERLCTIRLNTKLMNIFINVHAPTESKDEADKDDFYDKLSRIYDHSPGNMIKIVVGVCNAKIGTFILTIGTHSAHEVSNNNGQRLISFATSKKMTISSTIFLHKNIHKYT